MSDINIPNKALEGIQSAAKRYHVKKLVLFGSRARRTNFVKCDLDLAVYGCPDFNDFSDALETDVWTLLQIDTVNMDKNPDRELIEEIDRDGVIIYEEI